MCIDKIDPYLIKKCLIDIILTQRKIFFIPEFLANFSDAPFKQETVPDWYLKRIHLLLSFLKQKWRK